ncbi:MAG: tetratricopeptide repeat protein [Candidatus Omnitrophica bacterium]|nr:tetratricopeptide repeat protein [Candidatus Omnitrophota bacterium]
MSERIRPQEHEDVKRLMQSLPQFTLPEAAVRSFMEALDKRPQPQPRPSVRRLFDRAVDYADAIVRRLAAILPVPVPAAMGALVSVMAIVLVSAYLYLPQRPSLDDIKGVVKVFNAGKNEWMFAKAGLKVGKDDIVKTFEDSSVTLSAGDMYAMCLKSDTELNVIELAARAKKKPIQYKASKGKVLIYFDKRAGKAGKKFRIETNEVAATVLGTDFMLQSVPEFQKTWLGVLDGVVKVTSLQAPQGVSGEEASVIVRSQQKTEVSRGSVPLKPARLMEDEWMEMEELYAIGKKPQVALLISTERTRTRELLSIVPLFISDKKPSILPEKLKKVAVQFRKAVRDDTTAEHLKTIQELEDLIREYPNKNYNVQFLLFIGSYYYHIGRYEQAIAAFEEVLRDYPQSSLASIAQCAIGIIYEENLKDTAKARLAYQKILSIYPDTPEAEEAQAGLERLSR